jgi:hypothetical protein
LVFPFPLSLAAPTELQFNKLIHSTKLLLPKPPNR